MSLSGTSGNTSGSRSHTLFALGKTARLPGVRYEPPGTARTALVNVLTSPTCTPPWCSLKLSYTSRSSQYSVRLKKRWNPLRVCCSPATSSAAGNLGFSASYTSTVSQSMTSGVRPVLVLGSMSIPRP